MVLPDGPATRGAATSWRVYLLWVDLAALALPSVGIKKYLIWLAIVIAFNVV